MFNRAITLAAAALGVALVPAGQRRAPTRHRPSGSIAQVNRHTGEPHEHKREIARRLRRA